MLLRGAMHSLTLRVASVRHSSAPYRTALYRVEGRRWRMTSQRATKGYLAIAQGTQPELAVKAAQVRSSCKISPANRLRA